jgi:tetratricopeptide (TPR) repeat protein
MLSARARIGIKLICYAVRDTENGVARNVILARAAETYLGAGRIDEAAQLVEQALAIAQFAKSPHYLALARRVQGQIFAAQESYEAALREVDAAVAIFEETGSLLEHARALYHRAALLRTQHKHQAALADAVRARDAFSALGAERDRALAEQLLRAS